MDPFQEVRHPTVNTREVELGTAVLVPGSVAPGHHAYQPRLAVLPVVEAAPAVSTAGVRARHVVVQVVLTVLVQPEVIGLVLEVDITPTRRLLKFLDGFEFFLPAGTHVVFGPEMVISSSDQSLAVFHWKQTELGFLQSTTLSQSHSNK